jgi:chromosomal replication initiator protein
MALSISETIKIWDRVLEKVKERLDDKNLYEQFFASSYIHQIQGDTIVVVVNSALAITLIEKKYNDLVNDIVLEVTESNFKLKYIQQDEANKITTQAPESKPNNVVFEQSFLDKRFTFDNFVVGTFNREAAQAAIMIASNPGKFFNPLFIYSESGLGKTHLLHAVGNTIKANNPTARIVSVTSDDFFNEYVKFLTNSNDTSIIRDYCRNVDAFLIDDIQFLADKKKTQELFYYVFNDLIKLGKQIVITSDRQPSELKGMEDRLVTRFGSGLTVKIDEPDRDACVEILRKKIVANNITQLDFDEPSLNLLADKFSKNVRELEGALNRLVYYAVFKQTNKVDISLACEAVSTMTGSKYIEDEVTEQKIIALVADYYNMTPSVLTGNSHNRQIVLARHVAMYLIRYTLDTPLKKIGQAFGGKDHTTVMSGVSNVEKMLKTDTSMQTAINELKSRIKKE